MRNTFELGVLGFHQVIKCKGKAQLELDDRFQNSSQNLIFRGMQQARSSLVSALAQVTFWTPI